MKKTLLLTSLFFCFLAKAQNNSVATGGLATGTTGTISYSIGQVNYISTISTSGTILQGVQQPFEIITLGINDMYQIQLTATVYPNPTTQNVTLSILDFDLADLQYTLHDMHGKIITQSKMQQAETQIDMANLAAAHYFLQVSNSNQILKTFKIIKNN
jgi:Secretion system C-terminal sorting domain